MFYSSKTSISCTNTFFVNFTNNCCNKKIIKSFITNRKCRNINTFFFFGCFNSKNKFLSHWCFSSIFSIYYRINNCIKNNFLQCFIVFFTKSFYIIFQCILNSKSYIRINTFYITILISILNHLRKHLNSSCNINIFIHFMKCIKDNTSKFSTNFTCPYFWFIY